MKIVVKVILLFSFILSTISALSQSNFSLTDDSVCVEAIVAPVNQSVNSIKYLWHFNSANMADKKRPPQGNNIGNTGFVSPPTFIAFAEDSGEYYTFTTNLNTKNIVRNRYFNSLTNTPVSDNFNFNSLPSQLEGISVVKDAGNNWYGFIVGGKGLGSRLICLTFGKSLKNNPTVLYISSNNMGMNFPENLALVNDNGRWIGFTVNILGNSMTRFAFNSGLSNPPVATNLTFSGNLKLPWDFSTPVKDKNGNWYMFATCMSSNTLKRIEFGNSLLNPSPVLVEMNNSGNLMDPMAVKIVYDCEKTFGLIANRFNSTITQLDFTKGLNNEPVYTNLGNLGLLNFPQGMTEITRAENDIFVFLVNYKDSTLSRIQYTPQLIPGSSNLADPSTSYPDSGNFNINLVAWKDSVNKTCSCKNITVLEKPQVFIGNDTTICPYDKLKLDPVFDYNSYLWNTNSTGKSITADTAGMYWLEVTNTKGCTERDTITISHFKDGLFLGNDTTFTLGQSIFLNTGEYAHNQWSTGLTDSPMIEVTKPGIYSVMVKDYVPYSMDKYCYYYDTIKIDIKLDVPNFFTPNSDGINDTWYPNLFHHYPEAEVYIYDRFGKQLAHFDGLSKGWDGTYNNKIVETDTYWYVIDLKDGTKPIRGSLTVKTK